MSQSDSQSVLYANRPTRPTDGLATARLREPPSQLIVYERKHAGAIAILEPVKLRINQASDPGTNRLEVRRMYARDLRKHRLPNQRLEQHRPHGARCGNPPELLKSAEVAYVMPEHDGFVTLAPIVSALRIFRAGELEQQRYPREIRIRP